VSHNFNFEVETNYRRILLEKPDDYDIVFCLPSELQDDKYYKDRFSNGLEFHFPSELEDDEIYGELFSDDSLCSIDIDFFRYDNDKVYKGCDTDLGFSWVNPCRVLESFYLECKKRYDYYYLIEFDVFTPDWKYIFNTIDCNIFRNSDLIASDIWGLADDNGWVYYKNYRKKYPDDDRQCISALLSFMRISNRGLDLIVSSLEDKITDEIAELYYPTLLYNAGMTLSSLSKSDYYCGVEIVDKSNFDTNKHFRCESLLCEVGKLYHSLKKGFSIEAILYADDVININDVISFEYDNVKPKYGLLVDKLINHGFNYFEVYDDVYVKNNYIGHFTSKDIQAFLCSLDKRVAVKSYKHHDNPYSLTHCGENVNILHLNAYSRRLFDMGSLNTNMLSIPKDITIITLENDESKSVLIPQLRRSNIKFINAFELDEEHELPNLNSSNLIYKIDYIEKALHEVKTKYTLFLDSRDVMIFNFDDFMDKYELYGCDVLFGCDNGAYPDNVHLELENVYQGLDSRHINSGTIFGLTETMLELFTKMRDIRMVLGIDKLKGVYCGSDIDAGDQGFIRKLADTFNCWYNKTVIGYDYKSSLFMSGLVATMYLNYNNEIVSKKRYE
jgi:hypothetical protein